MLSQHAEPVREPTLPFGRQLSWIVNVSSHTTTAMASSPCADPLPPACAFPPPSWHDLHIFPTPGSPACLPRPRPHLSGAAPLPPAPETSAEPPSVPHAALT
eukprot:365280-Chlamydomonas_euryale.AAC.2